MHKCIVSVALSITLATASVQSFTTNYFTIEGTTGAGKSTLLRLLAEQMDKIKVVCEPVEFLQNVGGFGNLLELYYKDRVRWTYLFQTYMVILQDEAVQAALKAGPDKIVLGDRSVYASFYVFGKMLYQENIFSAMEWYVYKKLFDRFTSLATIRPRGFIYLRTTPDVCCSRIKKRSRFEELSTPDTYYHNEFKFHETWLLAKENIEQAWLADVPVLVLDGDTDFLHDEAILKQMVTQVRAFMGGCVAKD